jgi:hypothetical protein
MEGEFMRALDGYMGRNKTVSMQLVKVTAVHLTTCDGLTVNDDEVFDIRLRSVEDGMIEGLVLTPKIGSWLFVTDIGNDKHDHIALIYEAVESVSLIVGTLKIEANTEGVKIMNGSENLKTVFNDILDKMKTLKILTTTGIATVAPVDFPLIEALKNRLNSILK